MFWGPGKFGVKRVHAALPYARYIGYTFVFAKENFWLTWEKSAPFGGSTDDLAGFSGA